LEDSIFQEDSEEEEEEDAFSEPSFDEVDASVEFAAMSHMIIVSKPSIAFAVPQHDEVGSLVFDLYSDHVWMLIIRSFLLLLLVRDAQVKNHTPQTRSILGMYKRYSYNSCMFLYAFIRVIYGKIIFYPGKSIILYQPSNDVCVLSVACRLTAARCSDYYSKPTCDNCSNLYVLTSPACGSFFDVSCYLADV
jgi:hypothetical protein